MAWDRIGLFTFVRLSRPPALVKQRTVVRSRPGANGATVQRVGIYGQPFKVESFVDAASFIEAEQLAAAYAEAVGGDAVSVIYGNLNYDTLGHRYFILDAEPLEIDRLVTALGGTTYGATAFLRAEWELLPVRAF